MELITTNEARCRDCYRCVRACPVKAIRISTSDETGVLYARVINELCLQDARCILACPQKAKKVVSNLAEVRSLLSGRIPVAVGVAPSFAAGLPLKKPELLPALLRELGFSRVLETSLGAELVALEHKRLGFETPFISSACPVVVNLVERHYPHLIPMLAPLVSPMIAHGRLMKKLYPGYKTVFIGPCAAKKGEARTAGIDDAIDYVLGFDELWEWVTEENIDLSSLAPAEFDGPRPGLSMLFPIEGGMIRTVKPGTSEEAEFISVSGLENCIEFIKHLSTSIDGPAGLFELLACRGGCVGGPHMTITKDDIFTRRRKIMNYYTTRTKTSTFDSVLISDIEIDLTRTGYVNRKVTFPVPGEETIKNILEQTGKYRPEDELNCGACGYDSCRDKAVAVYQAKAELQMCIPYMRKRAESMSNLVMAAMPNAVIITNHDLVIKEVNPAAEYLFGHSSGEMLGQNLDRFMRPDNFLEVLETGKMLNRVATYPELDLVTREIIFPLENEKIIVGVLVDITAEKKQKEQFELMKGQTIDRAQEVITKQMMVAQEIAGLLGETTAETKVLLTKLIELMQKESV